MSVIRKAKQMYFDYASNHPTVHSNRFVPWEELPESAKQEWVNKANKRIAFEEDDCA